jgi:very-short-patch-repair endonuclease
MPYKRRIRTSELIQKRARELRKQMTSAESKLWERLRNRRLNGLKFRRQHPLGPFVADFYCPAHRLVVELDGDIHDKQIDAYLVRAQKIMDHGYSIIRFKNDEIENDIETVLASIKSACKIDLPPVR